MFNRDLRRAPLTDTLWSASAAPAPETAALEETVRADVAVVGAGYTGLSAALHLARRGTSAAVVEAEQVGSGGSGRNLGHCTPTFLYRDPDQVIRMLGAPWGERFVRMQGDAAALVFSLIRDYGIACEAKQHGLIQVAHAPSALPGLERRCAAFAALGKDCRMLDRDALAARIGTDRFHGAWLHPEAGHLNPLGYARGLARAALGEGVRVFTGSPVRALARKNGAWRVETAAGAVTADRVVIGTGAYSGDLWPALRRTFAVMVAFGLASAPLRDTAAASVLPGDNHVIDSAGDMHYYKLSERRIVTGGMVERRFGRDAAFTRAVMSACMRWLYPRIGALDWPCFWYGNMDVVPRTIPSLYELAPGVTAAAGYSGRGIPTATAMGTQLAAHAAGTPVSDLMVEVARPKPLRGRALMSFAPALLGPLQRRRDRRTARRDRIAKIPF